MRTWMKIVLLVAIGVLLVGLLGPVVGGPELLVIAALDAVAIGLVVRRDRRRRAAGV
jgi:hypothetical protein